MWVFRAGSMFTGVALGVLSSSAIILLRKKEPITLLQYRPCCHVAVSVLCFFLAVVRSELFA